jgi:hypothetical protein
VKESPKITRLIHMTTSAFIELKSVPTDDPLPARASLLDAIKDPDHIRWEQFHQTYRGLIIPAQFERRPGTYQNRGQKRKRDAEIRLLP